MKKLATLLIVTLGFNLCGLGAAESSDPPAKVSPTVVLATMKKVADWQLAQPPRHATDDWTYGALYAGMMALSHVADSRNTMTPWSKWATSIAGSRQNGPTTRMTIAWAKLTWSSFFSTATPRCWVR